MWAIPHGHTRSSPDFIEIQPFDRAGPPIQAKLSPTMGDHTQKHGGSTTKPWGITHKSVGDHTFKDSRDSWESAEHSRFRDGLTFFLTPLTRILTGKMPRTFRKAWGITHYRDFKSGRQRAATRPSGRAYRRGVCLPSLIHPAYRTARPSEGLRPAPLRSAPSGQQGRSARWPGGIGTGNIAIWSDLPCGPHRTGNKGFQAVDK